jgi:PAS domain S-box-containing protein
MWITYKLNAAYRNSSLIMLLKARFLMVVYGAMIVFILAIMLYSAYLQMNNPSFGYSVDLRLLGIQTLLLAVLITCAFLVTRGHFAIAVHITLITIFTAVWAGMILDRSEVISRLDTIVFILAVLSSTSLFNSRKKFMVLLYVAVNLVSFYSFMFYFRGDLGLSVSVFPEFLVDNTMAFLFIGFMSYNSYSINNRALEQLEQGNRKLQSTMEELKTTNEAFEAQNEELTRSEEELRVSEEKYRNLVENMNEVVFSVDVLGNITYLSPSIKRLGDFDPAGLHGKNFLEFIHPDDRDRLANRFTEISRGIEVTLEYRIISLSGDYRWVESSSRPFFHDGSFVSASGIFTDIHERRMAEEEKELTRMQLIQAQKMQAVGTLAGGIAHDFNNMLGSIMGSIDMIGILLGMDDHSGKETICRYVETVRDTSRRAADMTRQLLTLSRKSELKLAPVDVNIAMKHVHKLCESSFPKSVELDFAIGGESLLVYADPLQTEQVLLNLCVNASHAMTIMRPAGERHGGTLSVRAEQIRCDSHPYPVNPDVKPADVYIRISVRDSGVGINEEVRQHIFDPFYTTKGVGEGTGLGLAITYSIVKQHGGFIDVISEPGSGSTFMVYIPVFIGEPSHDMKNSDGAGIIPGGGRIMVIDDDHALLRVARGMLEHCGYSVITSDTCIEAIDSYRREKERIDVVLLDLSMPGMSGMDVYDRLKEINMDVKVLLSSGLIEDGDLQKARDRGIRGFIQKPYSIEDLSAKIKEISGRIAGNAD